MSAAALCLILGVSCQIFRTSGRIRVKTKLAQQPELWKHIPFQIHMKEIRKRYLGCSFYRGQVVLKSGTSKADYKSGAIQQLEITRGGKALWLRPPQGRGTIP